MAAADKAKPSTTTLSLPVSVVVLAITYIYFSTVFVFIDRWLGLFSSPGIINAAVFSALAAACALTYRAAISTDPGRVPATYMPDIEDAESPIHEIKRKPHHFKLRLWTTTVTIHINLQATAAMQPQRQFNGPIMIMCKLLNGPFQIPTFSSLSNLEKGSS